MPRKPKLVQTDEQTKAQARAKDKQKPSYNQGPSREKTKEVSDQQRQRLILAASMRCRGMTWLEIAPHIGRTNETSAQHIQYEYPKLWKEIWEVQREIFLSDKETTGLTALEELSSPHTEAFNEFGEPLKKGKKTLRIPIEHRDRINASRAMLDHCAKLKEKQCRADVLPLDADMEGTELSKLSDAQLRELIKEANFIAD